MTDNPIAGSPLDLVVILVSWNVRDLVLDAIRTVDADLAASALRYAIWVVDNASSDGTPDAIRAQFPQVKLFPFTDNLGFAAGNNVALRALGFRDVPHPNPGGPRAVYLLNPDTRTHPGATARLFETLITAPRAGVVGARLLNADGSLQHSAFDFPGLAQIVVDLYPLRFVPRRVYRMLYEGRFNGRYSRRLYAGNRPFAVGHTLGATMMIGREAIEATGLFDERFYMYVEEVDWSMRIRRAGFRIYCEPRAAVTHLSGQSTTQVRGQSLVNLWQSRFRFFGKYFAPWRLGVARRLVRHGAAIQMHQAVQQISDMGQRQEVIAAWQKIGQM